MTAEMSRVLVTGATGFVGPRLIRRLLETGAEVWAGVLPDEPAGRVPAQARQLPLDVRIPESIAQAVAEARAQTVFHLAAVGVTEPTIDPRAALIVNTGGAVLLMEALRESGVGRLVLVGTCYEYGARQALEGLDPLNFYAASKAATWAFARAYWRTCGLPIVVVRPFQVYGPGQPAHTLIPAAVRAALNGEDFPMTAGEQARDFVFVDDVVEGLLACAQAPAIEGTSIDLGTGEAHSVRQVVERIWAMTGASGRIVAGAIPYRPGEVMHLAADAARTARLTGWRARVSLEEGLRRTIQAFGEGEQSA